MAKRETAEQESTTVIVAAMIANLVIAVAKFGAALLTGSSAMLSEGVHSCVDTGDQVLLMVGLHRAKREPDELHPFGYGMEIYFWAFLVAVMLFGAGAGVSFLEGLHGVLYPSPVESPVVSFIVLGVAAIAEGTSWGISVRTFNRTRRGRGWLRSVQRSKDPSLFAVMFEDSAALLGLAAAAFGIGMSELLNQPIWDGIGSIMIALILLVAACLLARECHSLLTGEAAFPELRHSIVATATRQPGVRRLGELATLHFGPDAVLVTLSLDFQDRLSAGDVETTVSDIEQHLKSQHPEIRRIFIEAQSLAKTERSAR